MDFNKYKKIDIKRFKKNSLFLKYNYLKNVYKRIIGGPVFYL